MKMLVAVIVSVGIGVSAGAYIGMTHEARTHAYHIHEVTGTSLFQVLSGR